MKRLIQGALLMSQLSFAGGLGISDFISDFSTGDAAKLCSKRAKVDQTKCNNLIKDKRFRKEFLAVCNKVHQKMGADNSMTCLETIANKSAPKASRKQAEVCEELISSNSFPWVLRCLNTNVIEEFANICERYVEKKNEKAHKSAVDCIQTLDAYTTQDLDMHHFRGGCLKILYDTDFSSMASCLSHAEQKKAVMSGGNQKITERYKESAAQK